MLMSRLERDCETSLQGLMDDLREKYGGQDMSQNALRDTVQYVAAQTQDTALTSAFVPGNTLENDLQEVAVRLEQDTAYRPPMHFRSGNPDQYSFNDRLSFCLRLNRVSADCGSYALTMTGKERLQTMRDGAGYDDDTFGDGFIETVDALIDETYGK